MVVNLSVDRSCDVTRLEAAIVVPKTGMNAWTGHVGNVGERCGEDGSFACNSATV
jgi:hypothetical protein